MKTLVVATWCPVLLHGTYDVFLFVAAGECKSWTASLVVLAYACAAAFIYYITKVVVVRVEKQYPPRDVDVHELIKNGDVERPCDCAANVCCCDCCCKCCACCY